MYTVRHVNQLLALNDVALVEALFASLLRRAPDAQELDFYVGQLRSGCGKDALIFDVSALPDAAAGVQSITGLARFVARHAKSRRSLRSLLGIGRRHEVQLNRVENSIGQLLLEVDHLKRETGRRLQALEVRWDPTREASDDAGVAVGDVAPAGTGSSVLSPVERDDAGVDLSGASVAIRRIFRELSRAVESAHRQDPGA